VVDPTRITVKAKALLRDFFRSWRASFKGEAAEVKAPSRPARPLLVSRLENYRVLEDEEQLDAAFLRIRRFVQGIVQGRELKERGRMVFFEAGVMAPRRAFFYVKPVDASGLLFERSGGGWLISVADRIPGRELFIRRQTPLERASVLTAPDGQGSLLRMNSTLFNAKLVSFSSYEQSMHTYLQRILQSEVQ